MDFQVKKLKVYISTIPKQNSNPGTYHHLQGRNKLLTTPPPPPPPQGGGGVLGDRAP